MNYIRIPDSYKAALIDLASYTNTIFEKILDTLKNAKASNINSELHKEITDQEISQNSAKKLIDTLISLYIIKSNLNKTVSEITQDILETIEADRTPLDENKIRIFKERLSHLLSINSMEICAKATNLRTEYSKIFGSARIITDIRPVFDNLVEHTNQLAGIIITHNLKIEFLESTNQQEFYLALDSDDIDELIETLNRAKHKEKILRNFLSSCDLENIS